MNNVGVNENEMRLVWTCPEAEGIQYGAFLFNRKEEARFTLDKLRRSFPDYVIWVEDREHNKIDVGGNRAQ